MKKNAISLIILLGLLFAGYQIFGHYTISEEKINTYLQKHKPYQKELKLSNIANMTLTLSNLHSQIGRVEPNKVSLSATADIEISSLLGKQNAVITLTLKTQPIFDQASGSLYLKQLEVIDYKMTPTSLESFMPAIKPLLNNSLQAFFDENPAYTLDAERGIRERLAKHFAKGITICL